MVYYQDLSYLFSSFTQPQDTLIPEGLKAAPFSILSQDDDLVPLAVRSAVGLKEAIAISFGSTIDPKVPADSVLLVYVAPLRFELYQGGVLQIVVNERSLMHYEKMQDMGEKKAAAVGQSDAERHGGKEVVDYGEDGTVLYI